MPTIEFSHSDLERLLGKKLCLDNFREEAVLFVKGEVDGEENGEIKVDIKDVNRPDLWSVEGIARELRGHYKIEEGLPEFKSRKSGLVVNVGGKVEKVRPKTVCAVIKNLKLDDQAIKQMIQLQEKICQTFGRNRDKAAIGVYDYDKIKGPIRYTTFKPKELKFVPLGFSKEMDLEHILKEHPKGKEYGYLLKDKKEYPVFIDSAGNVLSMPPVINSNYTGKVDEGTRNVFIEVSGHNIKHISVALNVIVTALLERGGDLYSVDVKYDKILTTPNLEPRRAELDMEKCRRVLGMDISGREMVKLLRQARFDAKLADNKIKILYPSYRNDIMDERDLIEEVAISFGYNDIEPEEPKIYTRGEEIEKELYSKKVRETCIGLGLQEVLNYTLSNKKDLLDNMRIGGELVEIENPISSRWSVFRNSLIPGCLRFLFNNKHVEYPQRIFEIGDVIKIDKTQETMTLDKRRLSVLITDRIMGYENISSVLESLMNNLGVKYEIKEKNDKKFVKGRCASVLVKGKVVGEMGEMHPEVLENFGLEKPVVALEIDLEVL
ncbi:MAG: phenylalanine--tRNA ligase subunit beta [archaeon]|nr:MAG: phenylalanine--tRNA ligase subunit beta [archaeon]